MEQAPKIVLFYSFPELFIKDVESEIFTETKKDKFHFFLFHNQNLHFSKHVVLKNVLMDKFNEIDPDFRFDVETNSLVMTKQLTDMNLSDFDERVDKEYREYLSRINYRIDCIFQTFTLFLELYRDKPLIFVFPMQLYNQYKDIIKNNAVESIELSKLNSLVKKFDIFHWINYYTKRGFNNSMVEKGLSYKHVVRIEQLTNR